MSWFSRKRSLFLKNDEQRSFGPIPIQGGARWMSEEDIRYAFDVDTPESVEDMIFGKIGSEFVGYKPFPDRASGNRHVIVYGGSGLGKTTIVVINDLLQAIQRGDSFVSLDPKGETFEMLANLCKEQGYEVNVINMLDLKRSDLWNCLEETVNPATGRLDSGLLDEFITIYVNNMGADTKEFWNENRKNLLKAVFGYCAWEYEQTIVNLYIQLYRKVVGIVDDDPFIRMTKNELVSFSVIEEKIISVAHKRSIDFGDINEAKVREMIRKIRNDIPNTYTISTVMGFLSDFENNQEKLEALPRWHPARLAYTTYKSNRETKSVSGGALQGALSSLNLFSDPDIAEVFSNPGIHMRNINIKKTAMFVITDDKTTSKKALTSLIFSYLFKDAMQNSDDHRLKSSALPCRPFLMMLEEFASIGTMFGNPEEFVTKLNTARSRGITVHMILQTYDQLKALYGDDWRDTIQGACSTTLFLGCSDLGTAKMISELVGDATVVNKSESYSTSLMGMKSSMPTTTESVIRSPLVGVEDARGWDSNYVLVIRQGMAPVASIPVCPWWEHPFVRSNILPAVKTAKGWKVENPAKTDTFIEPLDVRLARIQESRQLDTETELFAQIKTL